MRRLALFVAVCCALLAQSASANPPEAKRGPLGVVPSHNAAKRGGGSNLSYHGGPVMHTNATYAIYWDPAGYTMDRSYISTMNRYLGDVAAASGANSSSNVYWSDTQYYDGSGNIAFSSRFAGSYEDTSAFPADGCSDPVSQTTKCLSDTQLRAEVESARRAIGGPSDNSTLYFIFTPKNVGSCDSSSSCAFSYYCAYHWNNGSTLYANQPYTMTVPNACGSGQSPNGNDADSTLNVVSHEHNEAITDPFGTAWFDSRGYENGDKCAWTFGTALGSTSSGQYNQLINGDPYYLQREWSNAHSGCVLTGV